MLWIDAELAAGAAAELVPELDRLVNENPYVERAWEQLMLAFYRAGRQADALDTYTRARRLLTTELGIEPGPALKDLHARILNHDLLALTGAVRCAARRRHRSDRAHAGSCFRNPRRA